MMPPALHYTVPQVLVNADLRVLERTSIGAQQPLTVPALQY
jgi:hypothetical protein